MDKETSEQKDATAQKVGRSNRTAASVEQSERDQARLRVHAHLKKIVARRQEQQRRHADQSSLPQDGHLCTVEFGTDWQRRNKALIESMQIGTVVAVNIADGRYVTGRNGLEAMDEFERVFGLDANGWAFEVGVPITLGGGLWQLSSEA